MKSETTKSCLNTSKKNYIKPTLEIIELRSDERIAGSRSSNNCGCHKDAALCNMVTVHGDPT